MFFFFSSIVSLNQKLFYSKGRKWNWFETWFKIKNNFISSYTWKDQKSCIRQFWFSWNWILLWYSWFLIWKLEYCIANYISISLFVLLRNSLYKPIIILDIDLCSLLFKENVKNFSLTLHFLKHIFWRQMNSFPVKFSC